MNEIVISKRDIRYGEACDCIADDKYYLDDGDYWINGNVNTPKISPHKGDPHVAILYETRNFEWFAENIDKLKECRTGAVILFSGLWSGGSKPLGISPLEGKRYLFYEYTDKQAVREFITYAHSQGVKVLGYTYQNPYNPIWGDKPWQTQAIDLCKFAREWGLEGWYFDGGWFGSHLQTIQAFQFLHGMGLKLFHHETVSMVGTNAKSWLTNPFGTMPNAHLDPYVEWTVRNESPYNKTYNGVTINHWPMDEAGWQRAVDYGGSSLNHMIWYRRSDEGEPPITIEDFNRECAERGLLRIVKPSNLKEWLESYYPAYEAKRKEAQDE